MEYDFDTFADRKNTHSLKWDVKDDELPMWVADMDFPTSPEIIREIVKRAEHGVFGYNIIPESWYDSYISWWKRKHNFEIKKEWLMFCTGVIPAISSTVRKLTTPAENVLVMTPVYNMFFNSIYNNGRNILEYALEYENGKYSIDFDKLEDMLKLPQTTLMILCNPQNPGGIIWDRDTLKKIGSLCKSHGVNVISDEIHCDLTDPGKQYIPFASVSEECKSISINCIAPTKAFSIPGLQTAAIFVPNEFLRAKVNRAINTDEVAEPNSFAIIGAIAAFEKGENWLCDVREYIYKNKMLAANYINTNIPKIKLVNSQATYLLWIDISEISHNSEEFAKKLREKTGLFLSDGSEYRGNGKNFVRMNIACPSFMVKDGLKRLQKFVFLS